MPPDPGWIEDEGYLAALSEEEDPGDPELDQDPDNAPPAGLDDAGLAALLAEAREVERRSGVCPVVAGPAGAGDARVRAEVPR